ncbi:hypothetical protein CFE70_009912 [Pyrenophora teres f. teres 0-1]|uniref:Uncharacterized protein n=1 Tax=Pyrenophora teres f. teres TaxID=97479 RepID=A0A6S6WQ92_9PLEO|nr:hypothetical protein P3342_012860 [Pyrenophora teres f. teres]CAE7215383.1 hypothetical protein PTTW11_10687 [Pyrenophora teres f. teres]
MDAQPHAQRCESPLNTPTSPTSSSGSYFHSSSSSSSSTISSPQVPFQIIVTFDGKVREMLRIEREVDGMSQQRRPRMKPRPRYYSMSAEQRAAGF